MIDATLVFDVLRQTHEIMITNGHTSINLTYNEADRLEKLLSVFMQELDERRIDTIGQNGNDGEHYE